MFTSVGPIRCPASCLDWTFDVPGIGVNENTRGLVCPSFEELFEFCLGCRSDEENETSVKCKAMVTRKEQIEFYTKEIGELLKDYDPGNVKHKPEVLKVIDRRDKERAEMAKKNAQNMKTGICITDNNGQKQELTNGQIMQLLQNNAKKVQNLQQQLKEKDEMIKNLTAQLFEKNKNFRPSVRPYPDLTHFKIDFCLLDEILGLH